MVQRLLHKVNHRPFALPERKWGMKQTWNDLLFVHWPVDIKQLQAIVPEQLELDVWEGAAWISAASFRVSNLRLRYIPRLPFLHTFHELNIRTYVRYKGIAGVYFFSLDASSIAAVQGARLAGLPYMHANIILNKTLQSECYFKSERIDRQSQSHSAIFEAAYLPDNQIFYAEAGTLTYWLTERYRMYYMKNQVMAIDLHHLPWPLQQVQPSIQQNSALTQLAPQIAFTDPPIHTYTQKLDVLVWPMITI